ncbi:MAG: hypothetical protein EHM61_03895, partial [Acidobacteria bacterium]
MDTRHIGCCPQVSRRGFLGGVGAVIGGTTLGHLSWPVLAAGLGQTASEGRSPLVVKPILVYEIPQRKTQTSWRSWGGIQTEDQALEEVKRIQGELKLLEQKADFPVQFLPVSQMKKSQELDQLEADLGKAHVIIAYGAGGSKEVYDRIGKTGKDVILFVRHKSGPVYLWYEIISPRYLRQHKDELAVAGVDFEDVVVDSMEEVSWRLRSLCGLQNTRGSRIVAIGGPDAWAQPKGVVPDLVRKLWKLDIQTVSYEDLGKLIDEARADQAAVDRARKRGEEYLGLPGTKLETERE